MPPGNGGEPGGARCPPAICSAARDAPSVTEPAHARHAASIRSASHCAVVDDDAVAHPQLLAGGEVEAARATGTRR